MWLRRSSFLAKVLLNPDLKTEVVHNIVAVGSTTPPPLPPFFPTSPMAPSPFYSFSCYSLSRAPARRTLSSIKAEGIDGEMIEHCAPQCSSMYRPAQREYVIHRSNWTMIDDVTFPSRPLLSVSSLFVVFLSLFLSFFPSVLFPLRHFER